MRSLHGLALLVVALAAWSGSGSAQEWELRVCGHVDFLPYSSVAQPGFEDRLAQLLADELGAHLTYRRLDYTAPNARMFALQSGECDVLMGVGEGHEDVLTTLAYYRSSYTFAFSAQSGFRVESLDDERLEGARIGVQTGAGGVNPVSYALARRGLTDNQLTYHLDQGKPGVQYAALEALVRGELDVAIAWGPVAGHFAREHPGEIELAPVQPQFLKPFVPMVSPVAMGVRIGDESLRDAINEALARNWESVQGLLREFGVPLEPLPHPTVGATESSDGGPVGGADGHSRSTGEVGDDAAERGAGGNGGDVLSIGLVVPTGRDEFRLSTDSAELAGNAARRGAVLAAESIVVEGDTELVLELASAPSPTAARRAGDRLVHQAGVDALIGGVGCDQARELMAVSEQTNVLFLNIGCQAEALRGRGEGTLHVAAAVGDYLRPWLAQLARDGVEDVFLVVAEDTGVEAADAVSWAEEAGLAVRTHQVPSEPQFSAALAAIGETQLDLVVLLLDWRAALEFLGIYEAYGLPAPVTLLPDAVAQTREFYRAVASSAPETGTGPRPALWDATLSAAGAKDLNDRFWSRWGLPLDPPGWAAYAALALLGQAAEETGRSTPMHLAAHLLSDGAEFDVGKGEPVSFDGERRQLVQPLYLVRIDAEADGLRAYGEVVAPLR